MPRADSGRTQVGAGAAVDALTKEGVPFGTGGGPGRGVTRALSANGIGQEEREVIGRGRGWQPARRAAGPPRRRHARGGPAGGTTKLGQPTRAVVPRAVYAGDAPGT